MLYEYALDPSLLSDFDNCRTIFESFKPERGKLIADVPRKWQQEAFKAINGMAHDQCQPVMKKTLKNGLKRLTEEALCSNRECPPWDRQKETWLSHALAAQDAHPFAAILAAATSPEPVGTYALAQLFLDAPECWKAPTEMSIPRSAKNIVDALMPLFTISKQITLIDRHMYPGSPSHLRVLKEIVGRMHECNFGRGVPRITLHVSDHRRDMQSSLEQHLLPYLPSDFEFVSCAWPQAIEHDRFAVTDVGGIRLGEGFDERRHDGTRDVALSLIGDSTRKHLLRKFSGQPTYRASVRKP